MFVVPVSFGFVGTIAAIFAAVSIFMYLVTLPDRIARGRLARRNREERLLKAKREDSHFLRPSGVDHRGPR
jgi:hypothetical protein